MQDETGAPSDSQQQRHHCCGAHTSSTPLLQNANAPLQVAVLLASPRADDSALDRAPQGLERPPRTIAIA